MPPVNGCEPRRIRQTCRPKTASSPAAEAPRIDEPIDLDPMEIERNSRRGGFLFGDIGGGPV